jgi:proline dehydrogenase
MSPSSARELSRREVPAAAAANLRFRALLLDRAIARMLPAVPRPVVQRLAQRYIAGPTLADACRVVDTLNGQGKMATIDVLGEEITRPDEARAIAQAYRDVFETIDDQGLDSNVSVKLTGLGLKLDYELCRENLTAVVEEASRRGNFVRIDMEDSSTTDDTLRLYRELRSAGHDNLGVVLQAYMRRTLDDVYALADLRPSVRLCKGIYLEPEEIAYHGYEEVRANYLRALEALLDAGCYVGIATHDEWLVDEGRRIVARRGLDRGDYEFQMLLGVLPPLGDRLVREGHRLRIYVPFGEQWYAYSMRRLQENPRIAGYVAADTIGRLLPGRNGSA